MSLSDELTKNNPTEEAAGAIASKAATAAIKKAGIAGGPAGIAISAALSIATSETGKKIGIFCVFILIFLASLVETLPSVLLNSVLHTNPYHSPIPITHEEKEKERKGIGVIKEQESSLTEVLKSNLKAAYDDALSTIPVMCFEMGVEADLSIDHLIDGTNTPGEDTDEEDVGEIIDTEAFLSLSDNDYNLYAIISAYSVSIEQLKPKKDDQGFHLFQLFEQEKDSKSDLTDKISKYYKQPVLGAHGNNVYKISYIGEEDGGPPTIFDDPEIIENEDGTTTVEHHYYIKPIIHNFDVQSFCEGSFGIKFSDKYKGFADVTVAQAVITYTDAYMALMSKGSASGGIFMIDVIPGGNTQRYVSSLLDPTLALSPGPFVSPFDIDLSQARISSFMTTRLDPFGSGRLEGHRGIDFPMPIGANINAIKDGKVIYVKYSNSPKGMGYHLAIDHGGGIASIYAHCSVILVNVGQAVKSGQIIAEVGSTGRSTGPHLHLEIIQDGQNVNPLNYF